MSWTSNLSGVHSWSLMNVHILIRTSMFSCINKTFVMIFNYQNVLSQQHRIYFQWVPTWNWDLWHSRILAKEGVSGLPTLSLVLTFSVRLWMDILRALHIFVGQKYFQTYNKCSTAHASLVHLFHKHRASTRFTCFLLFWIWLFENPQLLDLVKPSRRP